MMDNDEDISDEEPDFTCSTAIDRQRYTIGKDYGCYDYEENVTPLPFAYKPEHINPSEKDPSCSNNPDWPLAAYWPVYVANFRLLNFYERDTWYAQISEYFAYKGLLTRMAYFHSCEEEFMRYQKRSLVMDMLVYFTSKADAQRAVATCHRDSYYGFKLTVLPGRHPEYFANEKCLEFNSMSKQQQSYAVETYIDGILSPYGQIELVSRLTINSVVVQFVSVKDLLSAVSCQYKWKPALLEKEVQMQRFVEDDVKAEILALIKADTSSSFMDMQPKIEILRSLLQGRRPLVDVSWQRHTKPLLSPYHSQRIKAIQKNRDSRCTPEMDKIIKKRSRKKRNIRLKIKYGEIKASDENTAALVATKAQQPTNPTSLQYVKDTVSEINKIREKYGEPPVTLEFVKGCKEERKKAGKVYEPIV